MSITIVDPSAATGEMQFIKAILAADWTAQGKRAWRDVPFQTFDWEKIPHLAWRYKLRPMTAAALREAGWPGTPPPIRAAILAAERRCVEKAMWQLDLLEGITADAERANLRIIVLKGLALSVRLYGNPFVREAFDLDLLVHPDDSERLCEILRARDCRELLDGAPLTPRQTAILGRYYYDRKFIHNPSGTMIEPHSALAADRHLIRTDFEALWRARETLMLAGHAVAVLGEEDLVHFLIVHAARHGWERWKWLADLAALCRHADAAQLCRWRARTAREGNQDIFDSWLLLSAALATPSLPSPALEAARRNRSASLLAQSALHLSARNFEPRTPFSFRYNWLLLGIRLRLKPSLRRWFFELALIWHNKKEWYTLRFPDRFIWLYYVLRPFLFVGRRFGKVLAVFRAKRSQNGPASGYEAI